MSASAAAGPGHPDGCGATLIDAGDGAFEEHRAPVGDTSRTQRQIVNAPGNGLACFDEGLRPRTGPFDGHWVLCFDCPFGKTANWLRSFRIAGVKVIDGEGKTAWLQVLPDGRVMFEGGVLERWGDRLVRRGKKKISLVFRPHEEQDD
eukprot:gnl/TRDRNA2_/TRDRNA2_198186_c0_seq1.p1 gnl/TRDRNA2_/TRDRNA2_198186_c0~~gnl/TRDRNA2_/TRDRNA2_198186_c0_seq1.p1  ORF type:complete len:169 (+),score=20.36 gnl/TRDRNA2_/TRDRNA2_198186_c0_seq1:64-507(+)